MNYKITKILSVLIVLLIFFVCTPFVEAAMKMGGYQMGHLGINQGGIYSKSAFPVSVSTDINNETQDLTNLQSGKSTSHNYFKIVEVGDAGINKAIRQGNLKRVSIVMTRVHKINIPISILPLYYKDVKTVVYGNCEEDL